MTGFFSGDSGFEQAASNGSEGQGISVSGEAVFEAAGNSTLVTQRRRFFCLTFLADDTFFLAVRTGGIGAIELESGTEAFRIWGLVLNVIEDAELE